MKRLSLFGAVLVAVVALGAVLASAAFATLPLLLGWEGAANYTGKNDAASPTFETVAKETIVCSAATFDGTQTNDTTGSFHSHYTGCNATTGLGKFACNTEGDPSGTILVLGTVDFVYDHLGTGSELGVAMLFLPEVIFIHCSALVTLQMRGHDLWLVLEPLVSKAEHLIHSTESGGVQVQKSYWDDAEKEVKTNLEISKNGGAFEQSGQQALFSIVFTKAVGFEND